MARRKRLGLRGVIMEAIAIAVATRLIRRIFRG